VEDEFVVCPACGTRIKAGREFCLRCFGPLPTPDNPLKPPIWVSLGLSTAKQQLIVGIVAAAVVGLAAVIYLTEGPSVDETVRPAAAPVKPRGSPGAAAAPAASVKAPPTESGGSAGIFVPAGAAPAAPSALSEADAAGLEAKRASYEAQLARNSEDATLLNDLGIVLDQLGRPGDAIPRFERAIELSPQQANFHFNLARAAAAAGLWDQAAAEYREAARLRPQDYFSQLALALTLHRMGNDAAAIPEFERAIKLSPNDPNAHLSLGVSLETVGRVDEAVREFRTYLTIQPNGTDAERLRAHLQAIAAEKP
jgi:tetratricopeptide (TPR) repeat protein